MIIDEHHPDQVAIFLVATGRILDSLCADAVFVTLPQGYTSSVVPSNITSFSRFGSRRASKLSKTLTKYACFRYSRDGRPYIHELHSNVQVWKGFGFMGMCLDEDCRFQNQDKARFCAKC